MLSVVKTVGSGNKQTFFLSLVQVLLSVFYDQESKSKVHIRLMFKFSLENNRSIYMKYNNHLL